MNLPAEIIQLIVDYLPAKDMKQCLRSYQVYQNLLSFGPYSHLDLPYDIAKGVFVFALMLGDRELATSCQSKQHQRKYFKHSQEESFLNTLKYVQNDTELLDLMEKECSFPIRYDDIQLFVMGYDMDKAIIWWILRGYEFWDRFSTVETLSIIKANEEKMNDFFLYQMTKPQALSFVFHFPNYTSQLWHILKGEPNRIEYLLHLNHPNINRYIRSYPPHTWYNYLLTSIRWRDPGFLEKAINMNTLCVYLSESEEDLNSDEWDHLHRSMRCLPVYVEYMKGLGARHIATLVSVDSSQLHEPTYVSTIVETLHQILPKAEQTPYLTADHFHTIRSYLTDRDHRDLFTGFEVCYLILSKLRQEDTIQPHEYLDLAKRVCELVVNTETQYDNLYFIVEESLERANAHQLLPKYIELCCPFEKFISEPNQLDSSLINLDSTKKWQPQIQNLLPLFRKHWSLSHKMMKKIYGETWAKYWTFSSADELFSILVDEDLLNLNQADLRQYWRYIK